MKTAVSLPDDLFAKAEDLARLLGLSRSRLFAEALREYLGRHSDEALTRRLNEVYRDSPSTLDPAIERLQSEAIGPDEGW